MCFDVCEQQSVNQKMFEFSTNLRLHAILHRPNTPNTESISYFWFWRRLSPFNYYCGFSECKKMQSGFCLRLLDAYSAWSNPNLPEFAYLIYVFGTHTTIRMWMWFGDGYTIFKQIIIYVLHQKHLCFVSWLVTNFTLKICNMNTENLIHCIKHMIELLLWQQQ